MTAGAPPDPLLETNSVTSNGSFEVFLHERAASASEKSLLEGISLKVLCANPGKLLGEVMEHGRQSVGSRKTV